MFQDLIASSVNTIRKAFTKCIRYAKKNPLIICKLMYLENLCQNKSQNVQIIYKNEYNFVYYWAFENVVFNF